MTRAILFLGSFLIGFASQHENKPQLDLRRCIEIAAEYEVIHPEVPLQVDWYGVTDTDGRKLFVIRNASPGNRLRTTIHEFLHASADMDALPFTREEEEEAVRIKGDALYRELFGK